MRASIDLLNAADGWHGSPPPVSDLRDWVHELRVIKSSGEIALLQKAADASVAAHIAMIEATHDGQRERTLSGLIDYKLKENGCERLSYPSVIGSGVHATELHYTADADILHAGDVTCNIHSTEIASSQSATEFAYQLAAGDSPRIQSILHNTIIVLVPSLNPDGQQLVVDWYKKYVGTP